MRVEWKKLWSNNIIVGLTVLLFAGQLFQMAFFHKTDVFGNSKDARIYGELLEEFEGKLTEEKYQKFQNLRFDLQAVKRKKNEIYEKLSKGDFDKTKKEEIKQELEGCIQSLGKEYAVSYLGKQIDYVREDQENREVLDPIGWKELLGHTQASLWLLSFLFLVNTMLFTSEYESEMQIICITTRQGKRRQFLHKCTAGMLMSVLAVAICLFMQDILYFLSYDYSAADAPMQSVRMFEHAPFSLTLLQAYLAIRIMRIVGYLLFAAAAWVVSVFLEKFFSAFFVLASLAVFGLLTPQSLLYYFPIPMAAVSAGGFFRGKEWIYLNEGTEREIALLHFAGGNKFIQYLAFLICVGSIIWFVRRAYLKYGNLSWKVSRKYNLILVLCLILTGCGMDGKKVQYPDETTVIYSANAGYVGDELIFWYQDGLYGYKNGNLESIPLPPEIMEDIGKGIWPLCAFYREKMYMMISGEMAEWKLYCYDFENRKTELLEQTDEFLPEKLFGLIPREYPNLDDRQMISTNQTFFLYAGNLYFCDVDRNVWENEKGGKSKLLFELWEMVPGYNEEGKIAGIGQNLDLNLYDLSTGEIVTASTHLLKSAAAGGHSIYYSCYEEDGIFLYKHEKNTKILDGDWEILAATDGYCYLKENESGEIYVYEEKKGEVRKSGLQGQIFLYPIEKEVLMMQEGESTKISVLDLGLNVIKELKYSK